MEVIADKDAGIKPPSYRVTPGAWIVANLYGRIAPTPHVAYWPAKRHPAEVSLTPYGAPITTY